MSIYDREKIKKLPTNLNISKILYNSEFTFRGFPTEPIDMSDEEVYYIAAAVYEMTSRKYQRSIFQMMHWNCDDDTIIRFHNHFRRDEIGQIMYTC